MYMVMIGITTPPPPKKNVLFGDSCELNYIFPVMIATFII